ncbi:MAG: hypothetical protein WA741_32315 [Candidatus Sulfotelmatobacter sp.]
MFETLEDSFEKSKPPLDRGRPILMYSANVVLSSFALILEAEHGFSRAHAWLLFSLIVWAVMFLLSLTWLAASLKSSAPITRRDYGVRLIILQVLFLLAAGLADIHPLQFMDASSSGTI